jgi:hypothetical protein
MTTQTETNAGLRAREGRIELIAPHRDGELVSIYPAKGPGTYIDVGNQISEEESSRPTMEETASLVHAAWQNPTFKYSKKIINILRNNVLWGFNGFLYIPEKGVYIQDNPEVRDERVFMDEGQLVKKLEAGDETVRFVPFGFRIGEQSSLELSKNPFVIALAREQGAEKFAEIADKYRYKPRVFSFKSVDEPTIRVSALDSDWGRDGLDVGGDYYGYDANGCAFGVDKSGEATRAEK